MNLVTSAKRSLFILLTVSGLALYAFGDIQTEPCPLPETYGQHPPDQSPEKEECLRAVMHHGKRLCLPCPAHDAHRQHGDDDAGHCDKQGSG